jgi:hypothetical protein
VVDPESLTQWASQVNRPRSYSATVWSGSPRLQLTSDRGRMRSPALGIGDRIRVPPSQHGRRTVPNTSQLGAKPPKGYLTSLGTDLPLASMTKHRRGPESEAPDRTMCPPEPVLRMRKQASALHVGSERCKLPDGNGAAGVNPRSRHLWRRERKQRPGRDRGVDLRCGALAGASRRVRRGVLLWWCGGVG